MRDGQAHQQLEVHSDHHGHQLSASWGHPQKLPQQGMGLPGVVIIENIQKQNNKNDN